MIVSRNSWGSCSTLVEKHHKPHSKALLGAGSGGTLGTKGALLYKKGLRKQD